MPAGSFEVTLFSEVLAPARDLLADGSTVLVTADMRMDGEALRITAQDVAPLDAGGGRGRRRHARLADRTEAVPHIRALLEREGGGKGRVVLVPRLDAEQDVEIALPGGFNVSPRLAQAMKMLPGVERVEDSVAVGRREDAIRHVNEAANEADCILPVAVPHPELVREAAQTVPGVQLQRNPVGQPPARVRASGSPGTSTSPPGVVGRDAFT